MKIQRKIMNLTFLVWVFLYPTDELVNLLIDLPFNFCISTLYLYNKQGCGNEDKDQKLPRD